MSPDLPLSPSRGVGAVRRILILRSFPPFAHLTPDILASVAQYAHERTFSPQVHIHHEDTPVTGIHFLIDGEVEMRRHGRSLRKLGPRSAVGGLGLFAQEPEGYECIALRETTTLEVHADDVQDVFEDHFALMRAALRGLAREILDVRPRLGDAAGFVSDSAPPSPAPSHELDLVERMVFIRRALTFGEGRLDAIADLAREAEEVHYEPGTRLWAAGDPADHVLQVVSGTVECATEEGEQRFRLGQDRTLGGLDAMAERPRWYTARADDEVVALRIDSETLFDVFEDDAEMARDFLRLLARDLLRLYERAADLEGPARLSQPGGPDS
ncbi:MAG: cyclic nucleotide-binding domain-containing protein [Myxococcota bacterium]